MPRPPSAASDTDRSPWSERWCAGSGRRTTAAERPSRRRLGRSLPSWAVQTVRLEQRERVITADGSSIRELAGGATAEHYHRTSEEIYLFLSGMGTMRLDNEEAPVRAGDCVVIAPGAVHKL